MIEVVEAEKPVGDLLKWVWMVILVLCPALPALPLAEARIRRCGCESLEKASLELKVPA